ncbi:MAG: hypothetical protein RIR11_4314 [Bacteroidota bacterium]|jgi:hypothetical protein
MKKMLSIIILAIIIQGTNAYAQSTETRRFSALQLHSGYIMPQINTLPGGFTANSGMVGIGTSGYGSLGKRWLIGGSGFGTIAHSSAINDVTTTTDMGMGFADIGYLLHNKGRWISHVYAGIGGGGMTITYENRGESALRIADNLSVDNGDRIKISAGGLAWQTGLSVSRLLFDPAAQSGGWKIGLDLGVFQFPYFSQWKYTGNDRGLQGADRPQLWGGVARLNIGIVF